MKYLPFISLLWLSSLAVLPQQQKEEPTKELRLARDVRILQLLIGKLKLTESQQRQLTQNYLNKIQAQRQAMEKEELGTAKAQVKLLEAAFDKLILMEVPAQSISAGLDSFYRQVAERRAARLRQIQDLVNQIFQRVLTEEQRSKTDLPREAHEPESPQVARLKEYMLVFLNESKYLPDSYYYESMASVGTYYTRAMDRAARFVTTILGVPTQDRRFPQLQTDVLRFVEDVRRMPASEFERRQFELVDEILIEFGLMERPQGQQQIGEVISSAELFDIFTDPRTLELLETILEEAS